MKRAKWTKEDFGNIDWEIFGKVFKSYSRFYQIGVAKFVHNLWNTGAQKVLYKLDEAGLCPCCHQELETSVHVFRCLAPAVAAHCNKQIQQLEEFLAQQELLKPVKECIFAGVTEWLASIELKPKLHAPTRGKLMPAEQLATAAFSDQTALGWDAMFRGQISRLWRRAILLSS